jgi:very-short-patch-repair endonuclease
MSHKTEANQPGTDAFILGVVEGYRKKLLDLTSRNPLISFKHSERSRSHLRVIHEIPEVLFNKLAGGDELTFSPLPDPDLIPQDENSPIFNIVLRKAKTEDQAYREAMAELGPNPSARQKQRIERDIRNRVRAKLGWRAFEPTWDAGKRAIELGLNPDFELPALNDQASRLYNDSKIQTLFFADDLDRKLGALRDAARVLEKDAGFNALFCAFGYLEYSEPADSEEKRLAPLLFVPVSLDRILVNQRYSYFIKSRNEDVEVNIALAELARNLGVSLPAWEEAESEEYPLATYLGRIESAIEGKRDWRLRRYVTLGLFTFSTFVMYKDLDPKRWPVQTPLEQRPILRTLIAGAEISEIKYADDYEIDSLQGPQPLLITDADSSQHSAVVDALRNQTSQVIQGPPGTGKSQTITNIIAAALNEGLSVLFVSEKMAALEVVKKRLDAAGLEAFCLELHSSKTSKTAVRDSLARRLEYRAPYLNAEIARSNAEALRAAKVELLHYVQRVNESAGATGLKIYDVLLGSAIRDGFRKDLPEAMAGVRFGNPLDISPNTYRQMLDAAATLEAQIQPLAAFGKLADHPWRGIQNIEITELDQCRLVALLSNWNTAIRNLLEAISELAQHVPSPLPETQVSLEDLCRRIAAVTLPPALLLGDTYAKCSTEFNRLCLRNALRAFRALLACESKLAPMTEDISRTLQAGSKSLNKVIVAVGELGIKRFTVGSLIKQKAEQQQLALLAAQLEPLCAELVQSMGIQELRITSLRAAVAALNLLARLPRPLWKRRSPAILDESNRTVLDQACIETSALNKRWAKLDANYDLQLLPALPELRAYRAALRSANRFTTLFKSDCRKARRIYRSISRAGSKRSQHEMADALLRCDQYLADSQALASDPVLKSVCGSQFAGVETPFSELVEVSNWGTAVRQRLARFGETGLLVRDFLFGATTDQLDKLSSIGQQRAFAGLLTALDRFSEDDTAPWDHVISREHARSERLTEAVNVLNDAAFRDRCSERDIAAARVALAEAEENAARIESDRTALSLAGGSVNLLRLNIDALAATLVFADTVASMALPKSLIDYFFADPAHIEEIQNTAKDILDKCAVLSQCASEANKLAQIDPMLWSGAESLDTVPLSQLLNRNARALQNLSTLRDYLDFLLAENAASGQGIAPVLSAYSNSGLAYSNVRRAVEFVFFRSAAEAALNADERLRRHSGATHQQLGNRFRELDRQYLKAQCEQLAVNLTQRQCPAGNPFGPAAGLTELALVTRIAGQSRPRITVRDLVGRAGTAMQALKPCWMMSPMSVAQFLGPDKPRFDLVIMDEASQIRPEEALGAIARGEKAVIVGDQMQLPPSPFFQKLSAGVAGDEDDFEETKQESVLEAAAGHFYPSRRLKWHYRSEHGSLIAFSNHEFYNDQLTVFPSPYFDHPEYGVSLSQSGGIYEAGLNEVEGKAVVSAAIQFMKDYPHQSLGIVAVNAKQAEFIREELDRESATDEIAAAYVQQWDSTLEALFVKNLENVQGDERDVIFISTVYGKDSKGNFYQRFGPINGIYGHRRLNVLFTRAKKRVKIFTSMVPEEIQDEGKNRGVRVLKGYLQFARDGFVAAPTPAGECENEFEEWVLQVLQAHGYQGVPQVGVSGYRIDIGVRHPARSGVYLCGIECDGATYHSARSARERDRLRQEVLEKYGWKLYPIWSTDWFRNPNLQTQQLLKYLQDLHPPIA